jgi:hypothetical protein
MVILLPLFLDGWLEVLFISNYFLAVALLLYVYLVLLEKIRNQSVVIDNLKFSFPLGIIKFTKKPIHIFGVEFKVILYLLYPILIHTIEISLNYVSNFEIN